MSAPLNSEQDWQAADQLAQGAGAGVSPPPANPPIDPAVLAALSSQQAATQAPPIQAPPPVVIPGGAPAGALMETPREATSDTLNLLEQNKGLTRQDADIATQQANALAAKNQELADEKKQQAQDYNDNLLTSSARHAEDYKRTVDAYNEYRDKAGSLKDPSNQYWEDKGTGTRIASAFASFASGLGAGLLGHAGNPFMDFLNKQIDRNYDSHKQNIRDSYEKQVAAGHLQDNADSWSQFQTNAKLKSYDLSSEHIKAELEAIKQGAVGQAQKVAADRTINDISQQQVNARRAQAQYEATLAMNTAAQQRARRKEVQENWKDLHDKALAAGYGEDQASASAAKGLVQLGYNGSEIAPQMTAIGMSYDPKSSQWGKINPDTKAFEPILAEKPKPPAAEGDVPTTDTVTGKPLKLEERQKQQAMQVKMPDGSVRMANSAEDADDARVMLNATTDLNNGISRVEAIEKQLQDPNTDLKTRRMLVGEYNTITKDMITRYNAAAQGTKRATGQGEAHILGEDAIPEPPSALGAATREFYSHTRILENQGKINALKKIIEGNNKGVEGYLQGKPTSKSSSGKVYTKADDVPTLK